MSSIQSQASLIKEDKIIRLEAANERLVKALRPFAVPAFANSFFNNDVVRFRAGEHVLTYGDFRRAIAAIIETEEMFSPALREGFDEFADVQDDSDG